MTVTSTNLIQGPATLYLATFGATEPLTITDAPLAPAWRDLGGTKDGVTLNVETEYGVLEVDQIVDEVERRRTKRIVSVATAMAEATLENLAVAINNAGPVDGVMEADDGLAAFSPGYSAVILDGIAPGGKRRRVIVRKALATEAVEMAYKKDDQTLIPVTFTGHWVSASIRPFSIEDEPTA